MPQTTKAQHFIPQFHLNLFSDRLDEQGRVWVYDVKNPGRPPRQRVSKGICYEKHLYTLPDFGDIDPMTIEHTFRDLESQVAKIIEPYRSRDPEYAMLTGEEGDLLRVYLWTLIVRNPRYLQLRQPTAFPEIEAKLKKQGEVEANLISHPALSAIFRSWVRDFDLTKLLKAGLIKPGELTYWPHLLPHDGEIFMETLQSGSLAIFTLNEGERPYFLPDFLSFSGTPLRRGI